MYSTDKFDLGYVENIYDNLFKDRIEKTEKILEIGIQNGGSVIYWRDIFKNAIVYGLDIHECLKIKNEHNIKQIVGDAYTDSVCNFFDDESLDIIIDDGPHTMNSFLYLIDNYLKKIKINGLMVIEDIINTSWTPVLIDFLDKKSIKTKYTLHDMRFKQKTERLKNLWKNGLDVLVIERV